MSDTTIEDPLGRSLVLSDRTWNGHIIKGHPDIRDMRPLAEDAVKSPFEIRQSRSDEDCRIYFGPGPRKGLMMMVVVDVELGVVKTAHLARKTSGGTVEWSK